MQISIELPSRHGANRIKEEGRGVCYFIQGEGSFQKFTKKNEGGEIHNSAISFSFFLDKIQVCSKRANPKFINSKSSIRKRDNMKKAIVRAILIAMSNCSSSHLVYPIFVHKRLHWTQFEVCTEKKEDPFVS